MTEVPKHIDVIKIGILIGLAGVEKDVRISELTDEEGAAIATAAHAALVEAGFVVMPVGLSSDQIKAANATAERGMIAAAVKP